MKKAMVLAVAAGALIAVLPATADSQSLARTVVSCVYDSGKCTNVAIGLAPGDSVTLTKQALADSCKGGGYAAVGTANQGQCVSFVEHTLADGVTVVASTPSGGVEGLRDGNGGLIANIYSDGNGGLIANLTSDGNGGLIAN